MSKRTVTKALLVASSPQLADTVRKMFDHQGSYSFDISHVWSMDDAETHLARHAIDVVLLDFALADATGLEAVSRTHAAAHRVSIVLLCGEDEEQLASETMDGYVQDYLIKGQIKPHELMRAMLNAVARKSLQESLFNDKNRAQVTLNSIGDAVICTDIDGNISFLNPTAESMTGWPIDEVAGRPLGEAFHIIDASTGLTAANPMTRAAGKTGPTKMPPNCILVRRDGHEVYIEDSVAPIHDSNGLPAGCVLVFRDVTHARNLAAQVTHLAEHDALTGLPNRLLLDDRLGQAIARAGRNMSQVAVLFLDLDGFKHVNDSLGHRTGDKLLESVAKRLQKCVRTLDTVSRHGGDEFIVLLSDVKQPEGAVIAAGRILEAVATTHDIDTHGLRITASIGISIFPDDGQNAETLIRNADTAMYQAKASGKQAFKFFKQEMNVLAVERQTLEEELRGALERSEFALHYQPKFNLKSGAITGVEALLRWTHPTLGDIAPAKFIPIAESSGLILPIGAWVLREACSQARAWADPGRPAITMAVNVSSIQFRDDDFPNQLAAVLDETGLDGELLEIELTESVLMQRPEQTVRSLHVLRRKGIQVSMDDFGTGYSSLSYLSKLPLDAIKIDQSFVRQLSAAPESMAIVNAIISMAKSLKLRVIAEGVETSEELTFLKEQECDEAQGYYFSRAVTADRLVRLLKQ